VPTILIIDDEDKYLELCRRHMPEHDFLDPVRNFRSASEVLARKRSEIDLVLLDVHFDIPEEELLPRDKREFLARGDREKQLERLRRSQGFRILHELRRRHPDLPVIVMTSQDDLPLEIDAERLDAEDYTYLLDDEYLDARSLRLQVESVLTKTRPSPEADGPFYWGVTRHMADLKRRVSILARGQLPVIIQGPTGSGKSLLAREFIHDRSNRSGAFVAVDLSTIPDDLMAAHLFGVVKGAYTGATSSREGVLARASGGTLFLDEIGNLSLELQKSLLLVLQDRRYRPVGSVEERVADVKLVVATNEDLGEMVRSGRFREDLFMRLNPSTAVRLPSLMERRDDFAALLEFFAQRVCAEPYNRDLLEQYAEQRGLHVPPSDEAFNVTVGRRLPAKVDLHRLHLHLHANSFRALHDFDWPGNFRQFEMMLSNLVTFTLVELVEHPEQIEHLEDGEARPDVVVVRPRTVAELLAPWARDRGLRVATGEGEPADDGSSVLVALEPAESLNAVSCAVERQYLTRLYHVCDGDLGRVAEVLLGDADAGRKVQLRMNQLGLKLRDLKRARSG